MSTATLTRNAETILDKRYLQPQETVTKFWDRVSMDNPEYRAMLSSLDFLPNSPTLFNLGTGQGTLSACFKYDVPDSMEGILDVGAKAVMTAKFGGGVGFELSQLRPKGAYISTTHGKAMGPVAVLRWLHAGGLMVTQSGKRAAAQMAILSCDHPDIEEFITCKNENPQELSTFNISVALTDKFMELAAKKDKLRHERIFLWDMAVFAWKTGDPGCYFIDAAERENPTPWLGKLTGVNPCGEVPLLDNEACNLGSINLANFVDKDNDFQWERLHETVDLAIRYLDDVLDINTYPTPDVTKAVGLTRKLGLGVMGWADALALLGIDYESDEAVTLGAIVMEHIEIVAKTASIELAKEKGGAPCFVDAEVPYRNATRTCIAPTGTISIIAGCSSGIEPHFALEWDRTMGDGTVLNESVPVMDRLNGFKPKTSAEIGWRWHLKHQAAFQKNTDLAVSKTINMRHEATIEDIYNAYIYAWELGLKGTTVYRDGCRDTQVLLSNDGSESTNSPAEIENDTGFLPQEVITNPTSTSQSDNTEICAECGGMVIRGEGCETCVSCGYSVCAV